MSDGQEGHADSGARQRKRLPTFYIADALPQELRDAAELLDANITKPEHARAGDDWYAAIHNRAVCRIPSLRPAYDAAWPHYDRGHEHRFHADLIHACASNSRLIPGLSGCSQTQVKKALDGKNITFERAVVLIFSFNQILVDQISLLNEAPAGQEKNTPHAERSHLLKASLLPRHCVALAAFYFHDVRRAVEEAGRAGGGPARLIEELAEASGQSVGVVGALLGWPFPNGETRDPDHAVEACGTYPTLRRIFKYLETIPAAQQVFGEKYRDRFIQRLHVRGGVKKALSDEKIEQSRRINRRPYDWGPPREGEAPYPE